MLNRPAATLFAFVALAMPAAAQHAPGVGSAPPIAPAAARQFDFLIGEWSLDVRPRVTGLAARLHGTPRLNGTWKAWRAFDGWGIEDEMRVVNESGTLQAMTHALRVYDGTAQRWKQAGLDVLNARFSEGEARWSGREMTVTRQALDSEGKSHLVRQRFLDISATGFRYEHATSYDGGAKWDDPLVVMVATRTGATAGR